MKILTVLSAMCLMVTACGVQNPASGKPVNIPTVTMDCTTSSCMTNSNMFTVMYITAYACDEASIDFSVAASSSSGVTCTNAAGCSETFGRWITNSGATTTTVPTGTYNLCGIVANSSFSGSWNGHVVAVGQLAGQKMDGTQAGLNVNAWINGASF